MLDRASRAAALLALVAVSLIASVDLADHGWDITRFLRVGERASARAFVSADIPDTEIVPGWGHDGQANYVLAATFPDLNAADGHLDSVTYRARRIIYPALLAGVPRGRPLAVAMLALNFAAVAGAALAVTALARARGAPRLVGAIVGVTPAFVASVLIGLGDGLALAAVAWGSIVWARGTARHRSIGVALFTIAALTRETTLIVPIAWIAASFMPSVGSVRGQGRDRWLLTIPALITMTWIGILELWIGGPGKSAAQFTVPFGGWFAVGFDTREILLAAMFVGLSLWVASRIWRTEPVWAIVIAAEAGILCCVDRAVLFDMLNLARVAPWVIPWIAIVLLTPRDRVHDTQTRVPLGEFVSGRHG